MKPEYQKMQESLLPDQEKREEMWEKIVAESGKGGKQRRGVSVKTGLIGSVVAALLICALFLPQTGLADHIREVIQSSFVKGNDNLTGEVQNDLYSDQDEHVKMQISEMISDGACVYLGIRYRALDQEGRDFLFDPKWGYGKAASTADVWIFSFLESREYIEHSHCDWHSYLQEIEEMRTDDERYFVYEHVEGGDEFSFDDWKMRFCYAMPSAKTIGGYKQGVLDIKSNLDRFLYRVEKKDAVPGEGQAMYLSVSKLSYRLLMPGADALREKSGVARDSVKIIFTTKDGLEREDHSIPDTPHEDSPMMKLIEDVENKGEYQMLSGLFEEDNHKELIVSPAATLDYPDQIAAIEISGEQYDLIRVE